MDMRTYLDTLRRENQKREEKKEKLMNQLAGMAFAVGMAVLWMGAWMVR